jgi:hypothetical protein
VRTSEDIMKLREHKTGDLGRVQTAIIKLREAGDLLKGADANRATDRVRLALKSAEGAERHTARIEFRSERETHRG